MSDKGSINNITLPVYKKLKKEIADTKTEIQEEIDELAIEASKDIISQLAPIYNAETVETRIVFPPNILPLIMYAEEFEAITPDGEGEIFFNYAGRKIVDRSGNECGVANITEINGEICVRLTFNSEFTSLTSCYLSYCLFNGDETSLNTYNLYFPQSGTKLYRHVLSVSVTENNDTITIPLTVITNSSEKIKVQGGPPKPDSTGIINNVFCDSSNSIVPQLSSSLTAIYGVVIFNATLQAWVQHSLIGCTLVNEDVVTPL